MSSINTKDLQVDTVAQFLESITHEDNSNIIYLTFGKVDSWANDSSPPQANTSVSTMYEVWRNMIGAKKLTGNDFKSAVKRYTWTANTKYTEYDDLNANLYSSNSTPFYVLTSDNNIYKCLANNYSANSTVEPTAINANSVTQTADGYIWKYMLTLDAVGLLRFTTDDFIPVRTLTTNDGSLQWQVQSGAQDGAIYNIKVTSGGTGYANASNISISISGDGTGANAVATINNVSNTVNSIVLTAYGLGYTYATVTITDSQGTGATARAIMGTPGGHGSDPMYELGASYIVVNPRLQGSESGVLSTSNEFRQIALIKNPEIYLSTNNQIATNSVISQTTDLTVSGGGVDYTADEQVYQGTSLAAASFTAKVLEYNSANSLLKVIDVKGSPTNKTLVGANSTASKFVSSVDTESLQPYTGRLLFVNNMTPITRNTDQTEDFKIILSMGN